MAQQKGFLMATSLFTNLIIPAIHQKINPRPELINRLNTESVSKFPLLQRQQVFNDFLDNPQ
jgi:hypothetical protein